MPSAPAGAAEAAADGDLDGRRGGGAAAPPQTAEEAVATHASHDPVAWKYHHVGNFMLNDVLPPNHGQL